MNKLILDYSKWRCGADGENKVGEGTTALLNKEGYMCCLGQFAPQLNPNIFTDKLVGNGNPDDLYIKIPLLVYETEEDDEYNFRDTRLTENAIDINDSAHTTPEKKIELLQELFNNAGYEIEVINKF